MRYTLDPEKLSLAGQLASCGVAWLIGRFWLHTRLQILFVAFLGSILAMYCNIIVDGQGAFIYILFCPLIYGLAIVERPELDLPKKL